MGLLSNIDFLDHFNAHYRSTSVLFSVLQFCSYNKRNQSTQVQCDAVQPQSNFAETKTQNRGDCVNLLPLLCPVSAACGKYVITHATCAATSKGQKQVSWGFCLSSASLGMDTPIKPSSATLSACNPQTHYTIQWEPANLQRHVGFKNEQTLRKQGLIF